MRVSDSLLATPRAVGKGGGEPSSPSSFPSLAHVLVRTDQARLPSIVLARLCLRGKMPWWTLRQKKCMGRSSSADATMPPSYLLPSALSSSAASSCSGLVFARRPYIPGTSSVGGHSDGSCLTHQAAVMTNTLFFFCLGDCELATTYMDT